MAHFSFLLYALLIANAAVRLFTNTLNIVPRVLNILDVMLVTIFLIFFLVYRMGQRAPLRYGKVLRLLLAFNFVLLLGAAFNSKFIYFSPAVSQVIMLNEPLVLFLVLVNLPFSTETILKYRKLLVFLIVMQLVVGIAQIPSYLSTGETEALIGTFGGNAEQYASFLLLGFFYFLGCVAFPGKRLGNILTALGLLFLMLLIDNKASWLGVVVSIYFVLGYLREDRATLLQRARTTFIFAMILSFGYLVVNAYSPSLSKMEGLAEAWKTGNFTNLGKIKAYQDVGTAYQSEGHMLLLGSGPGTFYSRSGNQFYDLKAWMFNLAPLTAAQTGAQKRHSNSMAGVISLLNLEPYYGRYYVERQIYPIGSGQVDSPFASYPGLLGETGIIGTILYLSIYVIAFRSMKKSLKLLRKDRLMFPFAVTALGLLVYVCTVSIYNNWLETGRITTILWSMIAIVLRYIQIQESTAGQEAENSPSFPLAPSLAWHTPYRNPIEGQIGSMKARHQS